MKTLVLSAILALTSTAAFAGIAYDTEVVSSSGSDANGVLIVLVVIGALLALNGGLGSTRGKADATDAQDDDDVIMKF